MIPRGSSRRLYGFVFANLTVLPFRRYPGWMRFFQVENAGRRDE